MSDNTTLNAGPLGKSFSLRLAHANRTTRAIFGEAVEKPLTVQAVELSILAVVCENDGVAPSRLASHLVVSRPRISQCLDALQGRLLLDRSVSFQDGRGQRVHLTDAGRRLVKEALRRLMQAEEAALQCFSQAERALLLELLQRFTATVDP